MSSHPPESAIPEFAGTRRDRIERSIRGVVDEVLVRARLAVKADLPIDSLADPIALCERIDRLRRS